MAMKEYSTLPQRFKTVVLLLYTVYFHTNDTLLLRELHFVDSGLFTLSTV